MTEKACPVMFYRRRKPSYFLANPVFLKFPHVFPLELEEPLDSHLPPLNICFYQKSVHVPENSRDFQAEKHRICYNRPFEQ